MKKQDLQYQVRAREQIDTRAANKWLKAQGLDANSFNITPLRLLQAQQQAHMLLAHHSDRLLADQRELLGTFVAQMANQRTRARLKPSAAIPIFRVASKINRELFSYHRYLIKAHKKK